MPTTITPNLWFDTEAEEAARFYCSIFPNSRIIATSHYTESSPRALGEVPGDVMTVAFELDGTRIVGINGGPDFKPNEAVSLSVECATQEELDRYWDQLGDGGEHGPCGWLKDRFGFSWQVVPAGIDELFEDEDRERVDRAMKAMLGMGKLDIGELRRAADGVPAA